ncbi:MAG: alpha/beta fold hydrolase, partial [Pseudomonadota bacterium]
LLQGDPANPVMLFLHGFPQFSAMWRGLMADLSDRFFCVAPDQRGYNLSSKPPQTDAYTARAIAGDAAGLIRHVSPGRRVHVVGHDWGASIAYALAIAEPDLLESLIVINGVHPGPFQEALLNDPAQIAASQYIRALRTEGMEERLSADGCAPLFELFARFSDVAWMDDAAKAAYRTAWSQPGAVSAMLNWYRASPIRVPRPGEDLRGLANPFADREKLRIHPRHLLIWAEGDHALLPSSHAGLEHYCESLTRAPISRGGHWVVNAAQAEVLDAILRFI